MRAAISSRKPETPPPPADNGPSIAQLMTRAEAAQKAGTLNGNDGAVALYQNVLKQNPKDGHARVALRKIAQTLIIQANTAMDIDNVAQADKLLAQAESASADSPELTPAKKRLHEMHEQIDIDAKQQAAVTPADQARIGPLLDDAERAMAAGDLNHTPGDSAFDKYRAVLTLDANNAKARAGLQQIPARAKELFEQAMKNGTPGKARDYVEAVAQADPNDAALATMRDRLANAYLDRAESSIGEHRVNDATAA